MRKKAVTISNFSEIRSTLSILFEGGDVVELRILHTRRGTVSGYFDDMEKLAQDAKQRNGKAPGIYITVNPVNPDLLARSTNHFTEYAKYTTSDNDIIKRRWLPLDFDPIRPAGISSTDKEHEAALARAKEVRSWLQDQGWPNAILADSGNGAHLVPRIDLPNDAESTALIQRCLKALALRFTDEEVALDLTTYNAARIWKLYGTKACKGDSTLERPHRLSRLLDVPNKIEVVSRELLERLAAMVPDEPKTERASSKSGSLNLERWIQDHGLDVNGPHPWQDGRKWIFPVCPWNSAHTNRAAYLIQFAGGAIAAGCHHNGCAGKGWRDLRDTVEHDNLTSDYRDPPSEVRLREVNLALLQAEAKKGDASPLTFLPVLGQDRLIVKGWSHLIAGYPKAGKTELVVRMIAEWPEERILYITEEPESVWNARMRELPENYNHVTLYYGLGVKPAEILNRIKKGVETVVIIDTVRNLLGLRDETDNSEVARAMNPYIAAARDHNKTLIALHHNRKGGGEHGEGITGGHAFLAVVDLALEIKFDGADDSRRRQIRGWGRVIEVPRLLYELQDDNTMIALGSPAQVALGEVKERVREILSEEWVQKKGIREAMSDPKPSDDQVGKALNSLGEEGKVERDPPLSKGQRRGATYRWRLVPNLTSDDPLYRSEVRLGTEEVQKEKNDQCETYTL